MGTMIQILFVVFLVASVIVAMVAPSPIVIVCAILNALIIGFTLAINYF